MDLCVIYVTILKHFRVSALVFIIAVVRADVLICKCDAYWYTHDLLVNYKLCDTEH